MKLALSTTTTLLLASACTVSAQYFSDGWKPGQPISRGASGYSYQTAATGTAQPGATGAPEIAKSLFDISTYLESGPLKSLFNRAGVNISEKLEAARLSNKIWDERIPLIHDDNYEELIVNEEFSTLEEERERIWFLVITVSSAQQEGISKFVDGEFDKAFNLTLHENDLPNVRWGRIDYMNVTSITTKWAVWRAPYLVVLKDRGQTLRFYRPHQIRLQGEILREFLKREAYEQTAPWRSAFSPGGKREYMMEWLAVVLTKVYNVTIMIPRWLLLVISGSVASLVVNLLHRSSLKSSSQTPAAPVLDAKPAEVPAAPSGSSATAKSGGAKQRKGGKK